MPFYQFRQNNSFGEFIENDNVTHTVIIEAVNADVANRIAVETVGIYFNGCAIGIDCSCCGDRWDAVWSDDEGNEVPSIMENQ